MHQHVHDLAVEELEVGSVRHIDARRGADELIEAVRGERMQTAFLAAAVLFAFDHVVALLPQRVHLDDFFRRMLQIAVDHHAAVARRLREAGEDRRLLAEIAREMHAAHGGHHGCSRFDARPRLIFGTVVHKNQLVRDARVLQDGADGEHGAVDHRFLVERGKHNG